MDWYNNRPCSLCPESTKHNEPISKKKICRNCKKEKIKPEKVITDNDFLDMVKGIITFCKVHDWDCRFGEKKERYMKPGNFGFIELRVKCGCALILGLMQNKTYHLHSMELREEGIKEELFIV